MEPTDKIKNSFKNTVEHSNIPYILISKIDSDLILESYSPKSIVVIDNLTDFVRSGSVIAYVNNLSKLPVGKTLSDIVFYKSSQVQMYGEVIDISLFLIQLDNKSYTPKKEESPYFNVNSGEMTKTIYELRASISEATFYIDNLKEELSTNRRKVEEIEDKIELVESKLVVEVKDVSRTLQSKVESLQERLADLKNTISELKNNSLLKFTSDLDFKKTAAIIGLLISILSSAGLFEGWVSSSIDSNEDNNLEDKIERLLELSED